jgi:hypothetical protein
MVKPVHFNLLMTIKLVCDSNLYTHGVLHTHIIHFDVNSHLET